MVPILPDDRVVGLLDDELVTVSIQDFAWSREERRRELVRGLVVADQYLIICHMSVTMALTNQIDG